MENNNPLDRQNPIDLHSDVPESKNQALMHFFSGFALSGILIFVAVSGSAMASHQHILEFGYIKLAIASAIPLATGILSAATKGSFTEAIASATSNWSGF